MPLASGSLRIFRLFGIDVFVHWSWVVVAYFQIIYRTGDRDPVWVGFEYLTLFAIVLLHEFGHALATRSVGGEAKQIVLWPLGGVAFVKPPQRPGAVLWCIAAGPLVNVILLAPTILAAAWTWNQPTPLADYLQAVAVMNAALLVFNCLPFFPLDGGQMLRAILWFFMGPAKSLYAAAIVGLVGAALGVAFAVFTGSFWMVLIAGFAGMYSWAALGSAREQLAYERERGSYFPAQPTGHPTGQPMTRPARVHVGYACPVCSAPPILGAAWQCGQCGQAFDPFATTDHACPRCGQVDATTTCPVCLHPTPTRLWSRPVAQPPIGHPATDAL